MDNQEELQPQEQTTGTRPAWQVWAARVGLVLFIIIVILQYVAVARGGM